MVAPTNPECRHRVLMEVPVHVSAFLFDSGRHRLFTLHFAAIKLE